MVLSINVDKKFDESPCPFMINKYFQELRLERNFFNLKKSIYKTPTIKIILNSEILTFSDIQNKARKLTLITSIQRCIVNKWLINAASWPYSYYTLHVSQSNFF